MISKELKTLSIAWSIAISLDLIACGHVDIHDKEVCGDLGPYGAHCAHTLTDETRDIAKFKWDKERIGYLCMNATGFNDTENSIDQFCQTTNLCDYEVQQALSASLQRLRGVADRALAARQKYHK